MLRQVGHLQVDNHDIAVSGLIIRHLVLPAERAGSDATLHWIAENLGLETHIALMNQYFPAHLAQNDSVMQRKVSEEEYNRAVEMLRICDLDNGWVQDNN
jgi:putative pyruvate formate lyase activating enzyme